MGLIPSPGSMFPVGGDVRLVPQITVNQFFDRKAVTDALTRGEKRALERASLYVRRQAQRSIRKMGLAKPKLRIMSSFPGMSLGQISRLPGMTKTTAGTMRDSRGRFLPGSGRRTAKTGITDRERAAVVERIREIKTRDASQPGTPPHTHVPSGMMLGFRRNLYNGYDANTHSAVIGPSAKGPRPQMPALHEFGGSRRQRAYIWRPRWTGSYRQPILRWFDADEIPDDRWIDTGQSRSVLYPPRSFMRPALERSRAKIAEEFRNILGG